MATIIMYCTYAWAAERLGVSLSQVGRYVNEGKLGPVHTPLVGSRESARHKRQLEREIVETFANARNIVQGVVNG